MNIFEHVSLQEMVLLPKEHGELTFKYALRIAKLFSKHYADDPTEVFDRAKKFYDAISRVAHDGKCNKDEKFLIEVSEATRKLLRLYFRDNSQFEKGNLQRICLLQ